MSIYIDKGYSGRWDYLEQLALEYGQKVEDVVTIADMLGANEDFDGLVSIVQDMRDWL